MAPAENCGPVFFCYYILSIGAQGPKNNMVLHLLFQDMKDM